MLPFFLSLILYSPPSCLVLLLLLLLAFILYSSLFSSFFSMHQFSSLCNRVKINFRYVKKEKVCITIDFCFQLQWNCLYYNNPPSWRIIMAGFKNSSLIAADSKISWLDLSQDPREKENMIAKSKHFHLFFSCKDIGIWEKRMGHQENKSIDLVGKNNNYECYSQKAR